MESPATILAATVGEAGLKVLAIEWVMCLGDGRRCPGWCESLAAIMATAEVRAGLK